MTYSSREFVKLTIRQTRSGQAIWLKALRTTADFYGWTAAFPEWQRHHGQAGHGSYVVCGASAAHPPHRGGRKFLISRGRSKSSRNPGLVNQFRLSRDAGVSDIARVAYVTNVEWFWCEDLRGRRVSRDEWLKTAARIPSIALLERLPSEQAVTGEAWGSAPGQQPEGPRFIQPALSPSAGPLAPSIA